MLVNVGVQGKPRTGIFGNLSRASLKGWNYCRLPTPFGVAFPQTDGATKCRKTCDSQKPHYLGAEIETPGISPRRLTLNRSPDV